MAAVTICSDFGNQKSGQQQNQIDYILSAGDGKLCTVSKIKTARRNISHLRYADDTTLMAESEEELKSLLMKVKEE